MIGASSFEPLGALMGEDRAVAGRGRKADLTPEEAELVRAEMRKLQREGESNASLGRRLDTTGEWVGLIYNGKGPSEAFARKVAEVAQLADGFWRKKPSPSGVTKSATEQARVRWVANRLALPPAGLIKLWAESAVRLHEATPGEDDMNGLPEVVRDAALATVHLEDCTIEQALRAAQRAFHDVGPKNDWLPKHWLDEIRARLTRKRESGSRPRIPIGPSEKK